MRYTRHPETGNWENAEWDNNKFGPNQPGVTFSDGKTFDAIALKLELAPNNTAPLAPPPVDAGTVAGQPQQPMVPGSFAEQAMRFRANLLKLNERSLALFELPLDVMLTMVYRNATNDGLLGNGRMAIYAGVSQFQPDEATFAAWFDAYLLEIQRRRASTGGAEL